MDEEILASVKEICMQSFKKIVSSVVVRKAAKCDRQKQTRLKRGTELYRPWDSSRPDHVRGTKGARGGPTQAKRAKKLAFKWSFSYLTNSVHL